MSIAEETKLLFERRFPLNDVLHTHLNKTCLAWWLVDETETAAIEEGAIDFETEVDSEILFENDAFVVRFWEAAKNE